MRYRAGECHPGARRGAAWEAVHPRNAELGALRLRAHRLRAHRELGARLFLIRAFVYGSVTPHSGTSHVPSTLV